MVPGGAPAAALTIVNPVAVGVVDMCFFGPWWGLGTGLAAYALRKGVVVEYRTGGRRPHGHRAGRRTPAEARGDSDGQGCTDEESLYVREPWWRG
ncbi:hypothetical protein [Streptomyces cyaneofuscatus]|uniref:hypothetical protein n=1 Tax=Streptomyces cyaneofuscatus TaxID=66883 RepID=UPI003664683C